MMYKRGLTIIEVIASLVLLSILMGIAIWHFKKANLEEALKKDRQGLVAILEEARSLSLSAKEENVYGVRVETSKAEIFKGSVYNVNPDNKVQNFNNSVQVSSYSLNGGGQDIIFSRLTGSTDQYGSIHLSVVGQPLSSTTVTVKSTGVIE